MMLSDQDSTDTMMKATTPDEWLEECLEESKSELKYCEHKEKKLRSASKPHSTPLTLKWLEENYELAEGVCIPRSTLYVHYLDFCEKNDCQPVNAASFGKIIRQQFQHITTRRLGTRGQSKYHYYGIGIKETSIYYELMFSKNGVQSNVPGDGRKDSLKPVMAYSPRSKLGTLLPEFPDVKDLKLPATVTEDKVSTFVMMYRTHCQRILDTVIRANFDEVQSFLLHFWQGMPQHIVPILSTPTIVSLVGVCDSILYKALAGVLMPTVLQALPDSLTQVIRRFGRQLDEWLRLAMEGLPHQLTNIKLDLAHRFSQVLRRQTSLNHLCQAARTVIHSSDILAQMTEDWRNVDLSSICKQTLYTMDHYRDWEHAMIIALYKEFEQLLEEQAPLEAYTDWLDSMIQRCVVTPSARQPGTLRRIARQFLLMWSCFGTRVIRDMTLHSAASFGSFHLLHLMFDDYVLYMVESLHSQERAREMLQTIRGEHAESTDEIVLPRPALPYAATSACFSSPTNSSRQTVITDAREAYAMQGSYAQSPVQGGSSVPLGDSTASTGVPPFDLPTPAPTDAGMGGALSSPGADRHHPPDAATAQSTCYGDASGRYQAAYAGGSGRGDSAAAAAAAATYGCYPYSQAQYNCMKQNYGGRYSTEWDYAAMATSCSQQQQQQQQHHHQAYDNYQRTMPYSYPGAAYEGNDTLRSASNGHQGFLYSHFDTSGFFSLDNNNMEPVAGNRKRKNTTSHNTTLDNTVTSSKHRSVDYRQTFDASDLTGYQVT